jgi:hypothetical protein
MKKNSVFIVVVFILFSACRKTMQTIPGQAVQNYDYLNRIFRVKATATTNFMIHTVEYNSDGVTPYNSQTAYQSNAYDYGFTPILGHKITIFIQCDKGVISSSALFKGNYLDPIPINVNGAGTTASFTYAIKN